MPIIFVGPDWLCDVYAMANSGRTAIAILRTCYGF